MFDPREYLRLLGEHGRPEPTVDTLVRLHRAHLRLVPFDNARHASRGMGVWQDVDADVDEIFDRVVAEGEGGVCHELNGLFRRLLEHLGYSYRLLAAGVRGPGGDFGPDLEHMMLGVELDDRTWLTDVGFAGISFNDPIPLDDEVHHQDGSSFRTVDLEGYRVLQHRARDAEWQDVYRFHTTARALQDWKSLAGDGDDHEWNWDGEVLEAGTVVRSRGLDDGKLLLVGRRLLRLEDGRPRMRVLISAEDLESAVTEILRPPVAAP